MEWAVGMQIERQLARREANAVVRAYIHNPNFWSERVFTMWHSSHDAASYLVERFDPRKLRLQPRAQSCRAVGRKRGKWGFRAWTQIKDRSLVECPCSWAGHNADVEVKHYRVRPRTLYLGLVRSRRLRTALAVAHLRQFVVERRNQFQVREGRAILSIDDKFIDQRWNRSRSARTGQASSFLCRQVTGALSPNAVLVTPNRGTAQPTEFSINGSLVVFHSLQHLLDLSSVRLGHLVLSRQRCHRGWGCSRGRH